MKIRGNTWKKKPWMDYPAVEYFIMWHELSGSVISGPYSEYQDEPVGTKNKPWLVQIGKSSDGDGYDKDPKDYLFKDKENAKRFVNKLMSDTIKETEKKAIKQAMAAVKRGEYPH